MKKILGRNIRRNRATIRPAIQNDLLYLRILKKVLNRAGINPEYYSLKGYSEEAMCLEYRDGCWLVYNGERGNKYDMKKYGNIYDACLNLILRLSDSDEEKERMQNCFNMNLKIHKPLIMRGQVTASRKRKSSKYNK